jgi:chromosome segregation ATPase
LRRFIEILEAAALIAAIVALIGLVAIEDTVGERLASILASAQAAAQKFAEASDSLSDAARKQNSYLDHTSRELNKTVADAHDILIHSDASLNGRNGVLPKINELLAEQQSQLDAIERRAAEALSDLDAAEKQAQPIFASMNRAAASAASSAADPRIGESLERLDVAMGEADATLANLQATSASGNRDAQMIEKRLRQALKPASLAKSILLHALGLAGPVAQIASAAR